MLNHQITSGIKFNGTLPDIMTETKVKHEAIMYEKGMNNGGDRMRKEMKR